MRSSVSLNWVTYFLLFDIQTFSTYLNLLFLKTRCHKQVLRIHFLAKPLMNDRYISNTLWRSNRRNKYNGESPNNMPFSIFRAVVKTYHEIVLLKVKDSCGELLIEPPIIVAMFKSTFQSVHELHTRRRRRSRQKSSSCRKLN